MPTDISHINLATIDFDTLNRDELRRIATLKSIRPRDTWGSGTVTPSNATKYNLVLALREAQQRGDFAASESKSADNNVTSANITVKAKNVVLFLQGKGCGEIGTNYIGAEAFKDGRVRLANCDGEEPDEVEELEGYDNFWTTLDDLRNLVAALETYSND